MFFPSRERPEPIYIKPIWRNRSPEKTRELLLVTDTWRAVIYLLFALLAVVGPL